MIKAIVDGITEAVHQVVPFSRKLEHQLILNDNGQPVISAFIRVTGDYQFYLLLESSLETFSLIGEGMYGMKLDPTFTESFVGELLNMIGGHFTMNIQDKVNLDITPPIVNVGASRRQDNQLRIHIPLEVQDIGHIHVFSDFNE